MSEGAGKGGVASTARNRDGDNDGMKPPTLAHSHVADPALVVLPDDEHVLHSWKAGHGSAVQRGETVALAVKRDLSARGCTEKCEEDGEAQALLQSSATHPQSSQHKRPTRRRRPAPAPPVSPSSSSQGTALDGSVADASASSGPAIGSSSTLQISLPPRTLYSLARTSSKVPASLVPSAGNGNDALVPLVAPMDGILRIGPPPSLSDGGTSVEPYNKLVKGYIEICSHPTVVAGLCAVCGKTVIHAKLSDSETGAAATAEFGRNNGDDKDGVLAYSSSPDGAGVAAGTQAAMSRMTVSGGYTVSVSREEGERIAREDARRLRKIRKLSLVLDLDHTLVHATWDGRAHQHVNRHPDVRSLVLPVPILEGDVKREVRMHHYVKIRPHVKEFLSECQERYEIGVYTAGTREYAEQVTLILARHLVGATLDQVDLEIIRQKLSDVEQEMVRKKVPPNLKGEGREEPGVTSGEAATTSTEDPTVSANKSVESNAGEAQPTMFRPGKRKRVAFGEPPVDQRTDEVTGQQLESLRRELEEAEDLERRAVEAKQRLFGSRVVSRTDVGDLGRDVKSLRRIFPCGGTMAAVVDDREDVWANAQDQAATANRKRPGEPPDNLLLVRPYHWDTFLGFADVNNASGVDLSADPQNKAKNPRSLLSAPQRASSENDQQLLWTTDVLRRLHQRYYAEISDNGTSAADDKNNDDASRPSSVPEILSEMRREVLRGCRIVLSGVIPIHRQNHSEADRPRPTMERYVEELGGRVLPAVTREVTHVVAAKDGTDKIVAARRVPGCLVVKTSWLMECVWSLTRRDELPHLLGPAPRRPTETAGANTLAPPTGAAAAAPVLRPLVDSKKENSSASSEDDDDEDDELAAELESEFL